MIVRAYCTFIKYNSRFGINLPDVFYNAGKIINIINTPKDATDCLKVCINIATDGYTEVDKTTEALRREKGITVGYETIERNPYVEDAFSAYESPFRIHYIPTIARELTTKFNILKLHCVSKSKYSISSLYTNGDATCSILYYNNHFYYINDLDKLITFVTKRKARQKGNLCKLPTLF